MFSVAVAIPVPDSLETFNSDFGAVVSAVEGTAFVELA